MQVSFQGEEIVECSVQTEAVVPQVEIPISRTSASHRSVDFC